MPKKIRELKKILQKAGFQKLLGKGSHTNWVHPLYSGKVTISGKDGSDARASCNSSYNGRNTRNGLLRYQEKEIKQAIQEVSKREENG
ncbi:MAG: type II toxin-antitoxin system HicA family toxin [Cyanobacteria bacterium J06631_2]